MNITFAKHPTKWCSLSVSNKDNFQKPTPYKGKYYIRQYQPDMSRLQLLDQGINPDTIQPYMPLSPVNAANSKPPAKKSPDTPVVPPSMNNDDDAPATPGNTDTPAPTTSRKHKGSNLKKVAPPAKKKASPQEMKVRNILNRASSAYLR